MSDAIHGAEKKIVATYPGDRSEPERFRRLLGRVYGTPTPPPPPSKPGATPTPRDPVNLSPSRSHTSSNTAPPPRPQLPSPPSSPPLLTTITDSARVASVPLSRE